MCVMIIDVAWFDYFINTHLMRKKSEELCLKEFRIKANSREVFFAATVGSWKVSFNGMFIWENSDLFCDVWCDEVLVSLHQTVRDSDGGWLRQSIIREWNQFWSLIPEQLSSLTKNLITGASAIYHLQLQWLSQRVTRFMSSRAPHTCPLPLLLPPV